jgi:hypothetical protein
MVYFWNVRDNYPQTLVGTYDKDHGPDRFLFKRGELLDKSLIGKPRIRVTAKSSSLRKLHDIGSTAMVPLVSAAVGQVLLQTCPKDVQLFPAEIVCIDGVIADYSIVNVTNRVRGIDHERSVYSVLASGGILQFDQVIYKANCLGNLDLARDEEYSNHLVVSERLRDALRQYKDLDFRLVDCVV